MRAYPERSAAMELLRKYNSEPFHIQHALTVEGVMRWFAQQNGVDRGGNHALVRQ